MYINPYIKSTILHVLQKNVRGDELLRLAFVDIDSTLDDRDRGKTLTARKELEKKRYGIIFITSRTEEALISEKQRLLSRFFDRPVPYLGKETSLVHGQKRVRYFYRDPLFVESPGVIDPDIVVGSTGTAIWIKQQSGGYLKDIRYEKGFMAHSAEWRKAVLHLLIKLKKTTHFEISPLEDPNNYPAHTVDVAPPNFRIQVSFRTVESLRSFIQEMATIKRTYAASSLETSRLMEFKHLANLRIINDSKPTEGRYVLYITPKKASKIYAKEQIVKNLTRTLKIAREKLNLFVAGDSWPDLTMGISGVHENETFLLVGGSRLYHDLAAVLQSPHTSYSYHFGGEKLASLCKRFVSTQTRGIYLFKSPWRGRVKVIFGDERFPGTQGVESVLSYLRSTG